MATAFMAARTLLSSPCFLLSQMWIPIHFLMSLACLPLETLSSPKALCLYEAKPRTSQILSHTNLVCSVRLTAMAQCAHVLGHLVALAEARDHRVVQSRGCCVGRLRISSLLNATFWIISFHLPSSLLIFSSVRPSCLTLLLSFLTRLTIVHHFSPFFN